MDALVLSPDEIEQRASESSYQRGVDYHEANAVLSVVRRGDEVTARVSGSRAEPYEVALRIHDGQLGTVSCSCPDDRDGWCKHIVGVFLAIRAEDGEPETRKSIEATIADLSGAEMEAFVVQMVESRSEVQDLLEAWWETVRVLEAERMSGVELDPAPFRRRVSMLLARSKAEKRDEDKETIRIRRGIDELLALTDRLRREDRPEAALVALAEMTEAYLERWGRIRPLGRFPRDIVETLARKLARTAEEAQLDAPAWDCLSSRLEAWQSKVDGYGLAGVFLPARHAIQAANPA